MQTCHCYFHFVSVGWLYKLRQVCLGLPTTTAVVPQLPPSWLLLNEPCRAYGKTCYFWVMQAY